MASLVPLLFMIMSSGNSSIGSTFLHYFLLEENKLKQNKWTNFLKKKKKKISVEFKIDFANKSS